MAKEQNTQPAQTHDKVKKFPPYLGAFEKQPEQESLYFKKVVASSKESVKGKPYVDSYASTADSKHQPTPYYCTLTGIKFNVATSPYITCIECAKRNTFKETPYCRSVEEAESRFKYN